MVESAFAERRIYTDESFPVSCWKGDRLRYLAHWHPEAELIHVTRGSLRMGINQRSESLGPGDLAIVGSRDIHYYDDSDADCRYEIVIFSPVLTGKRALWNRPGRGEAVVRGIGGTVRPEWAKITELMRRVIRETEDRQISWQAMVRASLWEITARVDRLYGEIETGEEAAQESGGEGDALLDRMQLAIEYLRRAYREPVSLERTAKVASLSPAYFSRAFSRFTGQNLCSFVNRMRVERAKELLSGKGSIVDIALACGFESLRSFNRAFRAHALMTPRDYRARIAD